MTIYWMLKLHIRQSVFLLMLFEKNWCIRLPNLSWGKFLCRFTIYCCRTVKYTQICILLLWCTHQLIIDCPYCWLALQYIEESSSFIDWQFDCLFICLMFRKWLSKCQDKLAAKHIILFCLALIRTESLWYKTVLLQSVKYMFSYVFFFWYKLICNDRI